MKPLTKTQTAVALNLKSIITTYGDDHAYSPIFYSTCYRTGTALNLSGNRMSSFLLLAGIPQSIVNP